jgi:hypothetical protein
MWKLFNLSVFVLLHVSLQSAGSTNNKVSDLIHVSLYA